MALETMLKGIEREVSNDSIREPTGKYVIDGLVPKVVLYPSDVNELSAMMRSISKERLSVIPWLMVLRPSWVIYQSPMMWPLT